MCVYIYIHSNDDLRKAHVAYQCEDEDDDDGDDDKRIFIF